MQALTHIETPFKEKFGVPRQSLLISEAWGKMRFPKNDFYAEAFRGIEECSHLWLIFEFHEISETEVKALVRPPRFSNKKKLGIFATRSPHRPNRLGLSVVEFQSLETTNNEIILNVKGVDLVNGTPILDIKPYVPYADKIDHAESRNFEAPPAKKSVIWQCEKPLHAGLIEEVIALDPRPGQDKESEEEYGVSIAGCNARFRAKDGTFLIVSCRVIP